MDATESLAPPIFVARRMAASAEDMTVRDPDAARYVFGRRRRLWNG
jgi:hypothetical protein